jgi:prevent-host-death family protein
MVMILSASEDIAPVSEVKARFAELLDRSRENHRPVVVTQNGRATGVLMAVEDWEERERRMRLLELLAEGEESLRAGTPVSLDEVRQRLGRRGGR